MAPDWCKGNVASGLASGEGLIWNVRDPIKRKEPIREAGKKTGKIIDYQEVIADEGIDDKRLLVMESEFASVLQVCSRDRNTLSAVMRQAWDTGYLRTMTKNSPARATDAHISIVGHVTRDELRRLRRPPIWRTGWRTGFRGCVCDGARRCPRAAIYATKS